MNSEMLLYKPQVSIPKLLVHEIEKLVDTLEGELS